MINIDLASCSGFDNQYRRKELVDAYLAIQTILITEEFREEIFAFKFSDNGQEFSSEKVYNDLMSFSRVVRLSRYRSWKWWSKVVGYVKGKSSNTIYCNARFWDVASAVRNASFICHEVSHLAGYSHSSASSRYSVPYGINKCFEKAAARINYA